MESEEVDLNEELQHLEVEVEALESDLKEVHYGRKWKKTQTK